MLCRYMCVSSPVVGLIASASLAHLGVDMAKACLVEFVNKFPDGRDDSWLADILLILARNEVERIEHLVCFARSSSIVSS